MFLSLSNSMSCLRVSNAEDKSSSISCIGCPVSSELYKSSKRESTVVSVYGVYGMRFVLCPATYFQLSSVRVEYKPFFFKNFS